MFIINELGNCPSEPKWVPHLSRPAVDMSLVFREIVGLTNLDLQPSPQNQTQ